MSEQMHKIDAYIDHAARWHIPLAALMLSPPAFAELKKHVPRKQYRKRMGTKFINCYRAVPIHIHDEWSWGWMLRAKDGSFVSLHNESA